MEVKILRNLNAEIMEIYSHKLVTKIAYTILTLWNCFTWSALLTLHVLTISLYVTHQLCFEIRCIYTNYQICDAIINNLSTYV